MFIYLFFYELTTIVSWEGLCARGGDAGGSVEQAWQCSGVGQGFNVDLGSVWHMVQSQECYAGDDGIVLGELLY